MTELMSPPVEINFLRLIKNSIKANKDILDQLRFLKNIVSNLNIAIFIHDLKKLRHIWTNNNYYNIIGYSDTEIKQLGPEWARNNYHPDDIHIVKERIDYFTQNIGEAYSGVYRIKHKLGYWVWVYSNTVVFKRDTSGYPDQLLGICIDFSDNFKTMKQFKELFKENQQLKNQLQIEKLTKREREIIKLIAHGKTGQDIADNLHISLSTVNNHRKHILIKIGLHNIAELSHFATECGLD